MATSTSLLSLAPGVWIILFLLIRQPKSHLLTSSWKSSPADTPAKAVRLLLLLPTASLPLLQAFSLPLCSSSTSFSLTSSWSLGHPRLTFISLVSLFCFHPLLLGYFLDMWGKRTIWAQLQKEGEVWPWRAMRPLCQASEKGLWEGKRCWHICPSCCMVLSHRADSSHGRSPDDPAG